MTTVFRVTDPAMLDQVKGGHIQQNSSADCAAKIASQGQLIRTK